MKSLSRKLRKFPSRSEVCTRLFFTSYYGKILQYAAGTTFDMILVVIDALQTKKHVQLGAAVVWLSKKTVLTGVGIGFASLGCSIGAYVFDGTGSLIGELLFELLGTAAAGIFIQL